MQKSMGHLATHQNLVEGMDPTVMSCRIYVKTGVHDKVLMSPTGGLEPMTVPHASLYQGLHWEGLKISGVTQKVWASGTKDLCQQAEGSVLKPGQ